MIDSPEPKDFKVGDRFFDDRLEQINYEVSPDGICSYCGRDADFYELPDGSLEWSCRSCDSFNGDWS